MLFCCKNGGLSRQQWHQLIWEAVGEGILGYTPSMAKTNTKIWLFVDYDWEAVFKQVACHLEFVPTWKSDSLKHDSVVFFFHLSIFSKTSRLSCDDLWSSSGCIPTCTFKRKQTCVHRLVRHHKCTYSATSRHTDLNFSFCFCLKLYLFCTSNHSLHFCNFLFSHLSCQSKCWGL